MSTLSTRLANRSVHTNASRITTTKHNSTAPVIVVVVVVMNNNNNNTTNTTTTDSVIVPNTVDCWFQEKFVCSVDQTTGFVNVTIFCLLHGTFLPGYTHCKSSKTLKLKCLQMFGTDPVYHCNTVYGNHAMVSVFYHPVMFLHLALWFSELEYVRATITLLDYFNKHNRPLLDTLLRRQSLKIWSMDEDDDGNFCHVKYLDFEIVADRRCWYNATFMCRKHKSSRKNIMQFERLDNTRGLVAEFTGLPETSYGNFAKYTRNRFCYGVYQHPIVFMRMGSWLSVESFVKIARIVMIIMRDPLVGTSELCKNTVS